MLASVRSATLPASTVTSSPSRSTSRTGLPGYHVVGLPDAAVRESHASACGPRCCRRGLEWPQQRITVNLAPGGVRKTGAGLELAVALGCSSPPRASSPTACSTACGVLGELGLDGSVRPVPGVLALVDALARRRDAASVDRARDRRRRSRARAPASTCASARSLAELRGVPQGRSRGRTPPPAAAHDARRARPRRRAPRSRRRARARRAPGARSRSPPPAGITSCSPDRPASARRCSPAGCRRSSRRSSRRGARGHAHPLRRRPSLRGRSGRASARSARRTTRRRRPRSSAAASRLRPGEVTLAHRGVVVPRRARRVPAAARSTRCASRSRSAWCGSRARRCRSRSRPTSCSSRARTRARAGRAGRAAHAPRRNARAVPPPPVGAAARPLRPPPRGAPARARRRARRAVVAPVRERVAEAVARQQRALRRPAVAPERTRPRRRTGPGDPADRGRRRRVAVGDRARPRLTGRGAARVRRVARTLADLDEAPRSANAMSRSPLALREDVP